MTLDKDAIDLLKFWENSKGYHLGFSGGKDSVVIKHLATRAGVKFEAVYCNVTIDPPELVKFILKEHSDVKWVTSHWVNLFHRLSIRPSMPPTRNLRWCCDEFKMDRKNWNKNTVSGVRAEESFRRSKYSCAGFANNQFRVNPILKWKESDIWEYIKTEKLAYCQLYDEGFSRLGCVGCPLAGVPQQRIEFKRWPKYEQLWKRAIYLNWERNHFALKKNGERYLHSKFKTPDLLWKWWMREITIKEL